MEKNELRLIGVMSGTSLDGIDLILTQFSFESEINFKIITAETFPYPQEWKLRLSNALNLSPEDLNVLDNEYTEYLAEVINQFIISNDIDLLDAVCSHGHTVKHKPKKGITYQIGNLPKLAKLISVPVVCDFRVQDVEYGGQGAPLVPIGDKLLFAQYQYCINLGGFANISEETPAGRIAYDICPVNTVLNHYMRKLNQEYDDGGKLAETGKLCEDLLNSLNALQFYKKSPPKSLGIEWVTKEVFPLIDSHDLSIPDILHTFVVHAATQIGRSVDNSAESNVLLTGGGCFNEFLIEQIRIRSNCNFIIPDDQLVNFKEALIFAFLGALKLREEVNVLSSVTGAKMDHSSGYYYEP
ncbi:anhydro-N-acetylmuramic acid kinase [Christiangramia aquimixticola]|uniref:anhydro-N-acetylmuramic acid kinase n=1 Tax=Christiangramia aquimixticola TaxID=1697558 RepID=UPI003AA7F5BF